MIGPINLATQTITGAGNTESGTVNTLNGPVDTYGLGEMNFMLAESAQGAGSTLTVSIVTSDDGTNWAVAGTFAALSSAGTVRLGWSDVKYSVGRYVGVSWTLTGGTVTSTFVVTMSARSVGGGGHAE